MYLLSSGFKGFDRSRISGRCRQGGGGKKNRTKEGLEGNHFELLEEVEYSIGFEVGRLMLKR
jgi:hypothetical protein